MFAIVLALALGLNVLAQAQPGPPPLGPPPAPSASGSDIAPPLLKNAIAAKKGEEPPSPPKLPIDPKRLSSNPIEDMENVGKMAFAALILSVVGVLLGAVALLRTFSRGGRS